MLSQIAPAMRDHVSEMAAAWYRDLPVILRKSYNDASKMEIGGRVTEPIGHRRFDIMMPAVQEVCSHLMRIGNQGDGGKLICGLDRIPHTEETPCIVYSIGSNNQWDFETDIVRSTTCSVLDQVSHK